MRRYELMIIITDTIEEDDAKAVLEKVKEILAAQGGTLVDDAYWGKRQLAYEINKRNYGYYAVLDFEIDDTGLVEVERQLKIADAIVRFKTVRPDLRVRQSV